MRDGFGCMRGGVVPARRELMKGVGYGNREAEASSAKEHQEGASGNDQARTGQEGSCEEGTAEEGRIEQAIRGEEVSGDQEVEREHVNGDEEVSSDEEVEWEHVDRPQVDGEQVVVVGGDEDGDA